MSNIWFISDTHFCDEDIMRFEPILPDGVHTRTDLDEYIIERWNSVVRPEDVVYHLGDVGKFSSEEDAEQIIKRLNGDKYLIMGNHDYEIPRHVSTPVTLRNFWEYSGFLMAYTNRFFLDEYTILTHQPPQFPNAPYLWLFGHVHASQLYRTVTRNAICVCADRWNFTPVSIDTIQGHGKLFDGIYGRYHHDYIERVYAEHDLDMFYQYIKSDTSVDVKVVTE